MEIPVTPFMWTMALLPIVALLVLIIKYNWSAAKAAVVGIIITVITSFLFYKADIKLLVTEGCKGIWSALPILLIIGTAIFMYQVSDKSGAFLVIRNEMGKLLPNELLRILVMGWIFESFLQGITGFGVPVAVGAPLLIGTGVKPIWAVMIPLLGQSWGNTFGTLAAAWDALMMTAGFAVGSPEYLRTALWTALFILIWNAVIGILICWFYGKGKALRKGWPIVLIIVIIQGGGGLMFSQINTTLTCFVPSCISLGVIILLGRTKWYKKEWRIMESPIMVQKMENEIQEKAPADMMLIQAFIPFILLSALTLIVLLVKPIHTILGQVLFGPTFPETRTGYGYINTAVKCYSPLSPFTHASMFLLVSALTGLVYYKKHGWIKKEDKMRILSRTVTMMIPSGMAILGLIIMSKLMSGTGQTAVLANGITKVLKKVYIVFTPFVGLLGTFLTGSNMSSNILFGKFQQTTAELLNADAAIILGAQSAGGSIGSALSPSNIILGTATANIPGSEGIIIKKMIKITIPVSLVIGILIMCMEW